MIFKFYHIDKTNAAVYYLSHEGGTLKKFLVTFRLDMSEKEMRASLNSAGVTIYFIFGHNAGVQGPAVIKDTLEWLEGVEAVTDDQEVYEKFEKMFAS